MRPVTKLLPRAFDAPIMKKCGVPGMNLTVNLKAKVALFAPIRLVRINLALRSATGVHAVRGFRMFVEV